MKKILIILCISLLYIINIFPQNWLPLEIGNTWQFKGKETFYSQGIYYYGYWLTEFEVTGDTIINGTRYFKYLSESIRYSEEDKKIYVWYDNAERVHMDFTLIPGVSFLQFPIPYNFNSIFNNHEYHIATFQHGNTTLFGLPLNYKGFAFDTSDVGLVEYESARYAENFGVYYYSYTNENLIRENTAIMAVLYDSLGNQINYTQNHKPQITLIPLTIVNSQNFNITFLVEHPHSNISWNFNFIDSVFLESFYQKNDSLIFNENILASRVPSSANYQVTALLDTNVLKDGFDFMYRIIAKDKGIIPGITNVPDSGYYKCTWDFGTGIKDEIETPFYFSLSQNYPNQFNPTTSIKYRVGSTETVTLKVYDVLGREVATLVNEEKQPGVYEVEFSVGQDSSPELASGVYYYQLKTGNFVETKKLLLLK